MIFKRFLAFELSMRNPVMNRASKLKYKKDRIKLMFSRKCVTVFQL